MTGTVYDSRWSRMKRWTVRSGLFVGSGLALAVSGLLGGALFANVLEKSSPGAALLSQKLTSTMGGRPFVAVLALFLLLSSQWLRGKNIHLRQREYDYTGQRVLRDLRADPGARVPPFYLYLRAFETTGKLHVPFYLRLRRKCIWVAQRLVTDDLESYASLAVSGVAPLVALGKPGEAIGAGRIVTDDASWQSDIITLMRRAKGILLVPSDRPGTLWEMETLKQQGLLSKVVFIMPPLTKGEFDTDHRWDAARAVMATHGLEAPEHQDRGMLFRVGPEGKLANVEPLLLNSPRQIRKSLKRIFKTKKNKNIYKVIVAADKRAGRAAFWGWLENARQLSVFPVALLAVFMPNPNVGFDPQESWATVFQRSMAAREISEAGETTLLDGSAKYQALQASVSPENVPALKQALLLRGLPRIKDEELRAYYSAKGEMLARVNDKTCAALAAGEIQPAAMQIAETYIPWERIHDYLRAETAAMLAAAEDVPATPVDKNTEAAAWQQFAANLQRKDPRRYQHLSEQGTVTAEDKCSLLRAEWGSVETLQEPQATVWARVLALAGAPADESHSSPPEQTSRAQPPLPDSPPPATHPGPQRVDIPRRVRAAQSTAPTYEPPPNRPSTPQVQPPDPTVVMLENAQAAFRAGRLIEPANDCALYWALQLKQNGSPQGATVEQSVLDTMQKRIYGARASKNYDSAINDLNKLMQFYPGRNELVSLKSQILSEQQRQSADAQLKKFVLQHRHLLVANNGNMVQAYCVGVLVLAPDGTARFDCVNTFDPQGRCDHVVFPGGTIKEVKFLRNGLLHVATNHMGNFDFYGAAVDLQGAYQGLGPMVGR